MASINPYYVIGMQGLCGHDLWHTGGDVAVSMGITIVARSARYGCTYGCLNSIPESVYVCT